MKLFASFLFRNSVWPTAVLLSIVFLIAAATAMTGEYDHDEEQYIAAAVLIQDHTLYRDFIYLQTPMYPILMSPALGINPEPIYAAARWASGTLFALCCLCAFVICARVCRSIWAGSAVALLFCTSPLLLAAGGSARNDVLPCFFLLAGILAALVGLDRRREQPVWLASGACFLSGLSFALSVGTKLSYAFAPVMAFLYLVRLGRADRPAGSAPVYLAGCAAGALPIAYYILVAPHNFSYDTVVYHLTAPIDWYTRNELADVLRLPHRLNSAARTVANDPPVLAALGVIAWWAFSRAASCDWRPMVGMLGRFPHGLVAFMLVGSVPFGLLPSPMQGQYLIAVFALLIVLGVCSLSDGTARSLARLTVPGLIILVGVGVGALRTAPRLLRFVHPAAWSTTLLHEEALAMKAMLPAGSPCVATLSPIRALEAGARIYTELASGPFFFRSGDLLRPEQVKTLRGASPSTLAQILDEKPPAAVLVGYEGDDDWHIDLDGILVAYAASRNYREISVPAGDSRLFLNPHVSASCS